MWGLVGLRNSKYSEKGRNPLLAFGEDVFVNPARWADRVSSMSTLCDDVVCGQNAFCMQSTGACHCSAGFYPFGAANPSGCGPLQSASGCVCKSVWTHSSIWSSTHVAGCYDTGSDARCEVDKHHPS